MGWRKQLFGSERPSRTAYVALGALYAGGALGLYGFWIDFLPAKWLAHAAWYVAGTAGATCALWLARLVATGRVVPARMGRTMFILLTPLFAVGIAAVTWVVLVRAVAGGITGLSGTAAALPPMVLHTVASRDRHACHRQLRGAGLDTFAQSHLCTSPAYFAAHPARRVEVQIVGRQGPLGFYICGFRHLRDLGPYGE